MTVFKGTYNDYHYRSEANVDRDARTLEVVKEVVKETQKAGSRSRQRRTIDGNLRSRYYRDIKPVKERLAEVESEVARITERLSEIETALGDPEHYKDSSRVVETNMEYRELKESLKAFTAEWDSLTEESERIKSEFEEALENNY